MSRRNNTLPESGLIYLKPGEVDNLAPAYDFFPGVLHDSTVAMIYGAPGSGKTFWALHVLCSTALGRATFGVTPEKRRCLYVGLEGEASIKARIMAWCAQNGVDESPIHYALGRFSIAAEGDKDVSDLIEYMHKHEIGFVVIDTWSLAMAGLDEISGQHMSAGLDALHRIKRETGACVVAIAHTGKNEKAGIRGHSSQLGNVDTTIEVVVHNKDRVTDGGKTREIEHPVTLATPRSAVVRKQRDGEGGLRFPFTLRLQDTPFRDARDNILRRPAVDENESFADHGTENDAAFLPKGIDALAAKTLEELKRSNRRIEIPVTREAFKRALKQAEWKRSSKSADAWDRSFRRLMNRLEESELWGSAMPEYANA